MTLGDRFWSKVRMSHTCWTWTAARTSGYGVWQSPDGKTSRAHRSAYEAMVAPIPADLTIDHLCKNRACVNPQHMEVVTREENTRRAESWQAKKKHCPHGHPYDAENTILRPRGTGRTCRTCRNRGRRERRARRKAGA